ncbi:MAG: hypothetical protein JWM85_1064 [Acidimicrobiaceae bacterium]|nr:hypothetical protein [Acidimicrobiaceae bacterium]
MSREATAVLSKDIAVGGEYGIRHPITAKSVPLLRAKVLRKEPYVATLEWADGDDSRNDQVGYAAFVCPWADADEQMRNDLEQLAHLEDSGQERELTYAEAARMLGVTPTKVRGMLIDPTFRDVVSRPRRRGERRYAIRYGGLQQWIADPEREREKAAAEAAEESARSGKQRAEAEEVQRNADPGDWETKEALTVEEVAAILRMSPSGVTAALARGEIAGGFRVGTRWRVARRRFERFLASEPEPSHFTRAEALDLLGRALTVSQMAHLDFELAVTRAVELGASWDLIGSVLRTSGRQAETWYRSFVSTRMNSVLWPPRPPFEKQRDALDEPTSRTTVKDPRTGEELPLLLTMSEAGKLLGIAPATVRAMIDAQEIKAVSMANGRPKVVTASLLEQMGVR